MAIIVGFSGFLNPPPMLATKSQTVLCPGCTQGICSKSSSASKANSKATRYLLQKYAKMCKNMQKWYGNGGETMDHQAFFRWAKLVNRTVGEAGPLKNLWKIHQLPKLDTSGLKFRTCIYVHIYNIYIYIEYIHICICI